MKNVIILLALFAFPFSIATAQDAKLDSTSYSLGIVLGENLKKQDFGAIDYDALMKGLKDISGGKSLQIDKEEAQKIIQEHSKKRAAIKSEKLKKAGKEFLAANSKKEGIVTLPSGLQYTVLKKGTGVTPRSDQRVTVHYEGKLLDGTVFDSSYKRGEPTTFGITQVIKGWTEALQLMPIGSKWRLYIPEDLAYGSRGAGRDIGPYETLIFEVELIEIAKN